MKIRPYHYEETNQEQPRIIDYQTRSGERLYSSATKQLEDEKYDGEAYGLHQFLESLEKRSKNFGWDTGIMMIPLVIPDMMPSSLLRDYGTIDIGRVGAFESTYINTPTRSAQDTNLLYKYIMNSISKEGRAKITIWKRDYMLRGFPSGNLILKVFIRECHLDCWSEGAARPVSLEGSIVRCREKVKLKLNVKTKLQVVCSVLLFSVV